MITNPRKNKVFFNHDNLFDGDPFPDFVITNDPFERRMTRLNKLSEKTDEQTRSVEKKYNDSMKPVQDNRDIRNYPLIDTSLYEIREDEIRLSSNKKRAEMSFVSLFKERLENIQSKKETVSISIDAEVQTVQRGPSNGANRGIYKIMTRKTHGPYTVEMPLNLSNNNNNNN